MSPAGRSYDAIGLMKQLSEHTASAYADALEVLGNETPESIVKGRRSSNNPNVDKENNQLEAHSDLASNILVLLKKPCLTSSSFVIIEQLVETSMRFFFCRQSGVSLILVNVKHLERELKMRRPQQA